MPSFRQVTRFVLFLFSLLAAVVAAIVAVFARLLINPPRQRLWATPADVGVPYEDVHFPARDGLRISGWFMPAEPEVPGKKATVVLVHGWPWNRLGAAHDHPLTQFISTEEVNLLQLAHTIHQAGYHVLTFDLRNHGQSTAAPPVTFGWQEAKDLLGALDYLANRPEVDPNRIGVVGFSMGANTILFSLPQTNLVKAAVAVQPTSPAVFNVRYGNSVLGPFSKLITPLVQAVYQSAGGLRFNAIEPVFVASGAGDTPILYVQGKGDQWGSVDNVVQMAAVTPRAEGLLLVDSDGRFGGYQHVVNHPEVVLDFFGRHLA
jgi:dipeptidyl aminopeptidase/acylaminoacyl peptidase